MATKSDIISAVHKMIAQYTIGGRRGEAMWPESETLLDKAPLEFAIFMRRSLNVGKFMTNAAECLSCHEVIESTHVHDYVTCKCGDVSVDGGTYYLRRSFKDGARYEDRSANWPWIKDD